MREMELAQRRGELVSARDLELKLVTLFTSCRNRLLGIPSRLAQRLPRGFDHEVIRIVEALIREALEDLATGKELAAEGEVPP